MNPLKALRKERGLTQQEIADQFAISRVNYNRYETGARVPPVDMLEKFADYYGVSVDYLLGRTDVPYVYPVRDVASDDGQAVVYSTQPKSPEEQAELAARAIEFAKQQDADGGLPEVTALPGVDAEALARFVRSVVYQDDATGSNPVISSRKSPKSLRIWALLFYLILFISNLLVTAIIRYVISYRSIAYQLISSTHFINFLYHDAQSFVVKFRTNKWFIIFICIDRHQPTAHA